MAPEAEGPARRGERPQELIRRKRDGGELNGEELAALVSGYLSGGVGEGQMAALLMAGLLRGFSTAEAMALTRVLLDSGERLDLSSLDAPTVDKHSTGGVGDATTMLVAPLLAAAGCAVVKLAGRGLGHTGGTLDKLESIPGMRVQLTSEELLAVARKVGCVVAAQSDRLVPADRALYALRDVTATVESVALIASSVMSKKLAAGAQTIVLDVKAGAGAFMATEEDAAGLAELCVTIGRDAGRRCSALVTAMDTPLGHGIGNALEVLEVVELLREAPGEDRLTEVALDLAGTALLSARGADDGDDAVRAGACEELREHWASGAALERLASMVAAQGGDPRVCERPREVLPAAPVRRQVHARSDGVVAAVPAREIGELAAWLGAGRRRRGDDIDPAVGLELAVEVSQPIAVGELLAVVHAGSDSAAEHAAGLLRDLVVVGNEPIQRPPTTLRRIR